MPRILHAFSPVPRFAWAGALVVSLAACGPPGKTTLPAPSGPVPNPAIGPVADVHAHFFNGKDFTVSFAWYQATELRDLASALARYRKNRSQQHELYTSVPDAHYDAPFTITEALTQSPAEFGQSKIKDGVKFLEAAVNGRVEMIQAYFTFYPEVELVFPLFLDTDGWAHLGGRDDDFAGKPEPLDILRHEVQLLTADLVNAHDGLRVLPVAGFNPLHGVVADCGQVTTIEADDSDKVRKRKEKTLKLCRDFWFELSHGAGYVETFSELIAQPGPDGTEVSGGFVGAKIYPSLGYYPAHNCEFATQKALADWGGGVDWDDVAVDNIGQPVGHWRDLASTLPRAPLGQAHQWQALPRPDPASACAWPHQVVSAERQRLAQDFVLGVPGCGSKYPNAKSTKERAYCDWANLEMRLRLAASIDGVLDEFWTTMAELEAPVVAHASMEGAKLGALNHRYGDASVWQSLLASDPRVQATPLLLAHACSVPGSLDSPSKREGRRCRRGETFRDLERDAVLRAAGVGLAAEGPKSRGGSRQRGRSQDRITRLLRQCKPESEFDAFVELAVNHPFVYLDFANVHFSDAPSEVKAQMKAWLRDPANRQALAKISFGTDFWMLVREGKPDTYLHGHEKLV